MTSQLLIATDSPSLSGFPMPANLPKSLKSSAVGSGSEINSEKLKASSPPVHCQAELQSLQAEVEALLQQLQSLKQQRLTSNAPLQSEEPATSNC